VTCHIDSCGPAHAIERDTGESRNVGWTGIPTTHSKSDQRVAIMSRFSPRLDEEDPARAPGEPLTFWWSEASLDGPGSGELRGHQLGGTTSGRSHPVRVRVPEIWIRHDDGLLEINVGAWRDDAGGGSKLGRGRARRRIASSAAARRRPEP